MFLFVLVLMIVRFFMFLFVLVLMIVRFLCFCLFWC